MNKFLKTLFYTSSFLFAFVFISAYSQSANKRPASPAITNFTLFGRGMYPGDDSTYNLIKASGFTTVILSSFYIHADGDVYSGDDRNPIIHNGEYVGSGEWLTRVASLKKKPSSVSRIEILLEGRWYHQPPNTFDFIKDWTDTSIKDVPANIITGTGKKSTLYNIAKVLKEKMGADAVCIDDESVYDSKSIIQFGKMLNKLNMHMTLCPFTKKTYWKDIIEGSQKGLIDAVYLQCYNGGTRNTVAPWHDSLQTNIPVYPIFLCRGAFGKCSANHNSKTPDEIKAQMISFKKDYAAMSGGAIWQMADVKNYVRMNCAALDSSSGSAATVREYLEQLRNSLQEGLQ